MFEVLRTIAALTTFRKVSCPYHANAQRGARYAGYASRLPRLPPGHPDIITAIVNGKNPPQLTLGS
jgi:hypothetical protein